MQTKRIILIFILSALLPAAYPQDPHILKVIFRYGSVPLQEFLKSEYKETGGLYGGHVSLGLDSLEIGFTNKKKVHTFQKRDNPTGYYYWEYLKDYEDKLVQKKTVIIEIPLTDAQYQKLRGILMGYIENTPYDYAFFGIRCASATYEILSKIGIVKPLPHNRNIIQNFYPRLLRRKLIKLAHQNHYTLIRQTGRNTRIWERE